MGLPRVRDSSSKACNREVFQRQETRGDLIRKRVKVNLAKFLDIVTVDDDGVEAERFQPLAVGFHVVLQCRRLRLPEAVHVENRTQVVQMVVACKVESFPDRAFGTLTVTNQTVGPTGKEGALFQPTR